MEGVREGKRGEEERRRMSKVLFDHYAAERYEAKTVFFLYSYFC